MQPYFFPYIGYFEMMAKVDRFVFLDDVQYIRRGWVNRNRIRAKDKEFQYLTVPVADHDRITLIKDMKVVPGWNERHNEILKHTYSSKSHPLKTYYASLGGYSSLCDLLCDSLGWVATYLGLRCDFVSSSGISSRAGTDRIVDICRYYGATEYYNLSGGRDIYAGVQFGETVLRIMEPTRYPNKLSIIDLILSEEGSLRQWLYENQTSP